MRLLRLLLCACVVWTLSACHKAEPPPPKDESVDDATRRILNTKEFPFCKPTESAMPPWSREWCKIQEEATTCPQIKEMCGREWGVKGDKSKDGDGASASGSGKKAEKPKSKVGEGDPGGAFSRMNFDLPALKGLGLLSWIILGVMLAIIVALIIRAIANRQKTDEPSTEEEDEAPAPAALEYTDPGLGEVALLLQKARQAAETDVGHALSLLYAAALRHLEDSGLIHWDIAATNRHYVREIRGKTPLDRPVAELVREVERVKFGHDAPQRSVFDSLYQRIATALPRIAAVLVLAVFLGACGDIGDPGLDGHAAFNELLQSQGIKPTRFALPIDRLSASDPPILLDTRKLLVDDQLLQALEKGLLAGGRILLIVDQSKKWGSWPNLEIEEGTTRELKATEPWAKEMGIDSSRVGVLPKSLQLTLDKAERDPPDVLIERGGQPFAVRWKSDEGELMVLADRALISNGSLAVPANASLAFALVKELVGPKKELAEAMLGPASGADSPATSLNRAGVLPLMLQALLVLGVLFAARGLAFGKLRDRTLRSRRTFSEHVAALGLQFTRNRGSRFAASLFATYALERLWQRTGRETDRNDPAALAKVVAPRAQMDEQVVLVTLRQAEALRREPNGLSVPDADLAVIRQLSLLLQRVDPTVHRKDEKRRAA